MKFEIVALSWTVALAAAGTATPANPPAAAAPASTSTTSVAPIAAPPPAPPAPRAADYTVFAGDPAYPAGLAEKGVQGDALVKAKVGADGRLTEPSLVRTSHSELLDQAALAVVGNLEVKSGRTAVSEHTLRVVFAKDTLASLGKKSCADFNLDLAYFQAAYPERQVGDMSVFKISIGAIVAVRGFDLERIKRIKGMPAQVVEACAKDPDAKFLEKVTKFLG